jgi:CheY-like chemotaxis protein
MIVRILLIDDQPENVAALRAELIDNLPGCVCEVIGFEDANERIESHDPHVIVLDLLQGVGADAEAVGLQTRTYIWEKKFCPLVLYTAAADLMDEDANKNHPFMCVIRKGANSEREVLARIQQYEPHIATLELVAKEIRWTMNGVLREIAPRIFERVADDPGRRDALTRSARRRVAAKMDEALSIGGANLKSWGFYLCPPVAAHPLTGDVLRKRDGNKADPTAYSVILTPSCDLASDGARAPKVSEVLVSRCKPANRLLQDLNLQTWANKHKDKLLALLRQGYAQSCLPLPALPGEFPAMVADFRSLELIAYDQIGEADKDYIRIASVDNPLRELTAWAYLSSAARPALPERDFDAWADEIVTAL